MPIFAGPIDDLIFIACVLVGALLLLASVVVEDVVGRVLDTLHLGFEVGGVSLTPLALAFITMFGAGGLFATQVLDAHGGRAALVATGFGAAGFVVAWLLFQLLRRPTIPGTFSTADLVGRDAYVAVDIPAGRLGSVYVKAEGGTHEFTATASVDIAAGTSVTVTGSTGTTLIVAPVTQTSSEPAGARH